MSKPFEIMAVTVPGLEPMLQAEAVEAGFKNAQIVSGGVTFMGHWTSVWRANLLLRGATRILARIGQFRVYHLAELDRRAKEFPWDAFLTSGTQVKVDVTTKKSKIYHQGAAAERLENGIRSSVEIAQDSSKKVVIKARIENNICTLSIDTSGDPLHQRGSKQFVGKAPMRETLASLFLRHCGYEGTEPVFDPMCGSGTFTLEAAEIAAKKPAGRNRAFAFENLASFQPDRWKQIRTDITEVATQLMFYGSDRDAGAIKGATANADRADVSGITTFKQQTVSECTAPEGQPGLVMINPPYGERIGDKSQLFGLYNALGQKLKSDFSGWRVGLVTSDIGLAKASGLPFKRTTLTIPHGGIRITLFQTDALP